jgi:hypothetical protein
MKTLKNPPSSALSFIPQRETGSPLHLSGVFFMEKENNEVWKDIDGYEGYYQVSCLGRIRGVERTIVNHLGISKKIKTQIINTHPTSNGYIMAVLCKNCITKNVIVHRLVAINFVPNPHMLPEVNHKDENKNNNHYLNLEWCTHKYNSNYGTNILRRTNTVKSKRSLAGTNNGRKKLSELQVIEIYQSSLSVYKLAKIYNIHSTTVRFIKKKLHWKYVLENIK